ncbi:energy-coupling factor transporter ATPase [Anaerosalibacter bizertensis]|uniref:Energy-coupling factor transporter ATPase n=1 Tax=Anaerosalibacter bizertensis TaxID=932217 RepID=A0A844FEC7_9FIRM|nr:energy-coupling factor transporter ATPase [Anaerosalibacter bizertensis]MBV1816825.1 energy-coupling factor transporter ATPase [Bacteroidales bacterium MSK.15.36]HHV26625.1 energy-coupling factor transporter ATPase [Tissierellia bacterium]MCB5559678.1 energy-coupling factor transporter ATPase [Anaerosalibacter bizertensis]MCG4564455.1 energy-coupling factor transporter ATPase [Anaerosalibacter bizertensis]MCG4582460.1 energy-coupling factor transporter ATPase [Anaerosalibacter bizertensis]
MSNEMINIENATYKYSTIDEQGFTALKDVNLTVNRGEFLVVLGHNGSGKSTLAKLMNALLLPTSGNVYVKGMDTKNEEKLWDIRQSAGMVFQNPDNQLVATIVEEDVAFGPENQGIDPKEIRQRVDQALEIVEMSKYKKHAPHLLSGGQKQRIAIAGVLAMNPDCIILDEPTAMLDPIGRKEVMDTIKKLNKEQNKTIVHITHYMEEAVEADRIVVMEKGQIIMEGTPREVFSKVKEMKEIGLDVPQVTELAYELRKEGIDIPSDILTVEELVMAL